MHRSAGIRFLIVAALTLLMAIPLFLVAAVIDARLGYAREAAAGVGADWGGPQTLGAPILTVPVTGPVTRTEQRSTTDPATGETRTETVDVTETGARAPLYLTPRRFDAALATETELRRRGIFEVPVFTATADLAFDFDTEGAAALLGEGEALQWDRATLSMDLTGNRALRGETVLTRGEENLPLSPRDGAPGLVAATGDPRGEETFRLSLRFNGADRLHIVPAGRTSRVDLTSDWPHPSFDGAFLPDDSAVTEDGFTASWSIPHLARSIPARARTDPAAEAGAAAFGVSFYRPNDFYQKAFRAARYGILFIGLTFLTVFLIEPRDRRPVHPVQYILIGLAQSVFVLLMVSYAEQIGFAAAYAAASAATIALIVLLGLTGMKLGRRAWVLGGLLTVLYAVLYLILRSADYALLAGSTLAFLALAATVFATRNEDWYGPEKPKVPSPPPVPVVRA